MRNIRYLKWENKCFLIIQKITSISAGINDSVTLVALQSKHLLHCPIAAFFPIHPIIRLWCHHTATRGGTASCGIRKLPQLLLLPVDKPVGGCSVKGTSGTAANECCLVSMILPLLSRDSLLKHICSLLKRAASFREKRSVTVSDNPVSISLSSNRSAYRAAVLARW